MPAPVTTRPATKSRPANFLLLLALLAASPCARGQQPLPPSPPPPLTPGTQNQNHKIVNVVDLVVLHTTVLNEKGEFVPSLKVDNFRVFEDKIEQKVSVFTKEDIPVTMGLVIDNSGSMKEKRPQVNEAALSFVRTSNKQDEVFVVNFNDEYYLDLDEDFTSDPQELHEALEKIDTRGSTALYDAIIGSLDHLKKGHKDKRVLLVITDGDDDASRKSFEYTVKAAQNSNALVYAVGVFSDYDQSHDKRMVRRSKKILTELAEATGGAAFFPDNLDDVAPVCAQIARDIRNQYTLGYYPTDTAKDGTYRLVRVEVNDRGRGKLVVRTRTGYYAKNQTSTGQ